MKWYCIGVLILTVWCLLGCSTPPPTTPPTVSQLQSLFEAKGFTFTDLPAEGFEASLRAHRVGLSGDGCVQVRIYGETIPNRVALTVSGLPARNRTDVYFPDMVAVAQGLVPEWGDANQWLNTQIGFGQNQI